jgi:adenosylmethionine-8-amino-7-oxononanoate aminotransferase
MGVSRMNSEELLQKDRKYLWHPYTQMKDYEKDNPILIRKAKGCRLYDYDGKVYYDTISSWWCNVHGHNHPYVVSAIKKQLKDLDHVLFAGFTHKNAVLLGEQLVRCSPGNLTRVFYSDNGSTSCEVALKMSFQFWKNSGFPNKEKFIGIENGYHGDTIGAMSVGSVSAFQETFASLCFPAFKIPSPYCYRCPFGKKRESCSIECADPLEDLLKKDSENISGIILEPLMQGAGGFIIYPVDYLKRVAGLAAKYNIHLIADEVATGFGRTGRMFAVEHAGVEPDFMCLSKGITNGTLPLAATLTTEKVYDAFYTDYVENKTFYHGHTYTANPLSTAAGVASLELFEKEKTLKKTSETIPVFHEAIEKIRDIAIVGDVRKIGMVAAFELVKNRRTKEPFKFEERIGLRIYKMGLNEGLLLRPLGSVIYLLLPLCITGDELAEIVDRTYRLLAACSAQF